jgi:hypothetical protein
MAGTFSIDAGTDRQAVQQFVTRRWNALAALAYDGYRRWGRGVVLLNFAQVQRTAAGGKSSVKVSYVAEGNEAFRRLGDWPDENVRRQVGGYDPESAVVFVFVTRGGRTALAVSQADRPASAAPARLTPRQAYEAGLTPRHLRGGADD